MPRHPPIALSSLSPNQNDQQQKNLLKDARVHYTILKQQPQPNQTPTQR